MTRAFTSFDYLGVKALRWTVGESLFEVVPEVGARLMRWQRAGRDVLHWPDNLSDLGQIAETYGGNPILFPFPARCFVGGKACQWIDPDGMRRQMPMHGLAKQGRFALMHADDAGFVATFCPDELARECYPFVYVFSVAYRFGQDQLSCEFSLENQGNRPIPWSAGHHFYFRMPLLDNVGIAAHRVQIVSTKSCLVNPATQGKMVALPPIRNEESIDNPLLANAVIHYGLRSNVARLLARSETAGMEIILEHGASSTPPPEYAFVTWSPALDAAFYCVEPWMGPSNSPEHRTGLHWVAPGQRSSHVVTVRICELNASTCPDY